MMEETIAIDNLKCSGCANTIKKSLSAMDGMNEVSVDVEKSEVSISYGSDLTKAEILKKLSGLGYPEQGTTNTFQKAKSYVSCAVGRIGAED
jgi:copper chaperone CopZ